MTVEQQAQALDPGDLVTLFELDATALGGDLLRFTSTAWETAAVVFNGQTYTPIDIEADGFEWTGRGPLPTPKLRISNVNKVASSLVIEFDDLVGATVRRIRTFRRFLDSGSDPDPTATFPVDTYRVERKSAHNKVFIEWELAAAIDQEGRKLPARQVLRDACTHVYRRWNGAAFDYTRATCPYTGAAIFDTSGQAVSDPALDRCGKRLSDCRTRFGNAPLPTRAFPGLARFRA